MSSTSPRAAHDLAQAEWQLSRRTADLSFRNVASALGFFFERRLTMSSPSSLHHRGEIAPNGDVVHLSVDGGRGGDIDDVHATLLTIAQALGRVRAADERAVDMLLLSKRDGLSLRDIEKKTGISRSMASIMIGHAEFGLLVILRESGVVR